MDSVEIDKIEKQHTSPRETVGLCYKQYRQLTDKVTGAPSAEQLDEDFKRLELGVFRLVVMGEIKKGKSSFINALLSQPDLLPIASDIATSTVYKLMYGSKKSFKVFFKPDLDTGSRRSPLGISAEELAEWGTEAGNPDNQKGVDFIGVQLPNELLKQGLVIVDTPGVGGLYRKHRDITLRYAPNADAVLFVLDSVESVISRDEIDFLKDLVKNSTKRIFFVQTKIDAAGEDDWKAWKERNQSILADEVGLPIDRQVYFPVSAKTKEHADKRKSGRHLKKSGYLDVQNYLNQALIPAKEAALASDFATRLAFSVEQLRSMQRQSAKVLKEESKEKLVELQQKLGAKKQELTEWSGTRFRQEMQTFSERLADLKRHSVAKLREELDPNGTIVSAQVDRVANNPNLTAHTICEKFDVIQQELISEIADRVKKEQASFNAGFEHVIKSMMDSLSGSIPANLIHSEAQGNELGLSATGGLGMHFGKMDALKNSAISSSVGGSLGFAAMALASVVFPPAAAVAGIASILGMAAGGWFGKKDYNDNRRNEAINRLRGELSKITAVAQRKALEQFDEISIKLERESRQLFQNAVKDFEQSIQAQIEEVKVTAKSTKEENVKQLALVEARLKKTEAISNTLQRTFGRKS